MIDYSELAFPLSNTMTADLLDERGIEYFHFAWDRSDTPGSSSFNIIVPHNAIMTPALKQLRAELRKRCWLLKLYTHSLFTREIT